VLSGMMVSVPAIAADESMTRNRVTIDFTDAYLSKSMMRLS
jgi:hypothetical protein